LLSFLQGEKESGPIDIKFPIKGNGYSDVDRMDPHQMGHMVRWSLFRMVIGPTGVGKVKSSRTLRAFSESLNPAFLIV
jgi:hypothetical protein